MVTFIVENLYSSPSYLDLGGAAEVLQDGALLSPVFFSVSVHDRELGEYRLTLGDGGNFVNGGASFEECRDAIRRAAGLGANDE